MVSTMLYFASNTDTFWSDMWLIMQAKQVQRNMPLFGVYPVSSYWGYLKIKQRLRDRGF